MFCAAAVCNHLLIRLKWQIEETEYKIDRFELKPCVSPIGCASVYALCACLLQPLFFLQCPGLRRVHKSHLSVTHTRLVFERHGKRLCFFFFLNKHFNLSSNLHALQSQYIPLLGPFCCGCFLEAVRTDTDAVGLCCSGLRDLFLEIVKR